MRAIPLIHHAGLRIVPHPARPHKMPRVSSFLKRSRIEPDLLRPRKHRRTLSLHAGETLAVDAALVAIIVVERAVNEPDHSSGVFIGNDASGDRLDFSCPWR